MTTNYESILERVGTLLVQHEFELALSTIRTLDGEDLLSSARGQALALEVIALEFLERPDDAETLIAETMKEEGDDLAFILATGTMFSELEEYGHAELFLRNLCDLDPENAIPWYTLAVTYGRDERFAEALQAYDHALERNPDFAEAHLQKGHCLRLLGDVSGSIDSHRAYLQLEPNQGAVWTMLGILESEEEHFEQAYDAFQHALDTGADKEEVWFDWGVTAQQAEDLTQANTCLTQLQTIAPTSWRCLLLHTDLLETEGDLGTAWDNLTAAFHAALADGEEEEAEYVAGRLLPFAYRNDLREALPEWLELIFANELFSEEILEILRYEEGNSSESAVSFQVLLRSTEISDSYTEYYVYGVLAESPEEAEHSALSFQARCDEAPWYVESTQSISAGVEAVTGVYWRSERSEEPPDPIPT